MKLNQFDAIIYDMDGVLTDSEPIWKIAMEEVFHANGCLLTRNDFEKTVGLRIDEVCEYWFNISPWKGSAKETELQIVQRMQELLSERATPLTGVIESLNYFRSKGKKIGLATSSYEILIETILQKLGIKALFDFTHSAEKEQFGKPHPAVYLTTAKQLNVNPLRCLVIEDSLNGIISGKAARMKVVCVPEKTNTRNPKLTLADLEQDNLLDLITYFNENP